MLFDTGRAELKSGAGRDLDNVADFLRNDPERQVMVEGFTDSLAKEIVHGVIIDRCPTCRGVWLDGGEMERMNPKVAHEVWKPAALGRPLG